MGSGWDRVSSDTWCDGCGTEIEKGTVVYFTGEQVSAGWILYCKDCADKKGY